MFLDLKKTTKFGVFNGFNQVDSIVVKSSNEIAPIETEIEKNDKFSSTDLDIEQSILTTLENNSIEDTWTYSILLNRDHQSVVGAVKSLLADHYVKDELLVTTYYALTDEGKHILTHGSPEYQVYQSIPVSGKSINKIQSELGDVGKIGLGKCLQNKWVRKEGDKVIKINDTVSDDLIPLLYQIYSSGDIKDDNEIANLKKRKLIQQITRKSYRVSKGLLYQPIRIKKVANLTKDMLGNISDTNEDLGHWSKLSFKPVNLNSMGASVTGGNFHPLLKVRTEFRRILMDMGFEEMPTNKWVESSFWNFDSLFQPQSHPARDAHDTFFIKDPDNTNFKMLPQDYYDRVKSIHEDGGYGSVGYGCVFKKEESMKNLLRTHTTAISAQMLYQLANQSGGFTPKKYFSIDRVFRNEAMDATHLCEFHQVEGLVADRNLTLGNLISVIRTFFEKIGITEIRFKPAYNPYTEPSMEVFGYHPELKKWTELGNSGMFRPEMLRPMGLPEDVRVIAWGLSLERPTMIKYRIENIRDLFGHKADLIRQKNVPVARF